MKERAIDRSEIIRETSTTFWHDVALAWAYAHCPFHVRRSLLKHYAISFHMGETWVGSSDNAVSNASKTGGLPMKRPPWSRACNTDSEQSLMCSPSLIVPFQDRYFDIVEGEACFGKQRSSRGHLHRLLFSRSPEAACHRDLAQPWMRFPSLKVPCQAKS
jgi:hypothetical protein